MCLESVLRSEGYEEQVKNYHDRWTEAAEKRKMVCILIEKRNFTGTFFLLFEQGALCFHFALGRASEGAGSASNHYS